MKAILSDIGLDGGKRGDFKDSGDNVQFCCPFHGERNPSAGIRVEDMYGGCFSCGESFTLVKLVAHCKDFVKDNITGKGTIYDYAKASEWLEANYGVDPEARSLDIHKNLFIVDDEDELEESSLFQDDDRFILPKSYIAPFQSGLMTHEYYYTRGFDDDDVIKFKVGWDKLKNRITFPAFYQDMELAGVVGRVVIPEEDPRYEKWYKYANSHRFYIYENAPIAEFLYPLWLFKPRKVGKRGKRAILVEGYLDAQWMHKMGYTETLSTTVAKMAYDKKTGACPQRDILEELGITEVILMKDNDKAGRKGQERDHFLLKDYMTVYTVEYPKGYDAHGKKYKDPQQLTKEQIDTMIGNKRLYQLNKRKLRRLK